MKIIIASLLFFIHFVYAQKEIEQADKHFQKAIQYFYYQHLYLKSWEENEKACALKPEPKYLIHKAKMLYLGKGTAENPRQAVPLARKQVKKLQKSDKVFCLYMLGWMHQYGLGVNRDYKKAVSYYLKAAALKNPMAMNNLGYLYKRGLGVKKDKKMAVQWYQQAAQLNLPSAMNNLGYSYQKAEGVVQDYKKALQWYQKAAAANHILAMKNLGFMYKRGVGVKRDLKQAKKWYKKAAKAKRIQEGTQERYEIFWVVFIAIVFGLLLILKISRERSKKTDAEFNI